VQRASLFDNFSDEEMMMEVMISSIVVNMIRITNKEKEVKI
jgi:hypothetical protein